MAGLQTTLSFQDVTDVLVRRMEAMATYINRQIENSSTHDVDVIDSLLFRLEQLHRQVTRMADSGFACESFVQVIRQTLIRLRTCDTDVQGYQAGFTLSGERGRPRYCISREQLSYLVEERFNREEIAKILGVSVSTVQRRLNECGLSIRAT